MIVGIAVDNWKLQIFERHLDAAGITFFNAGPLTGDTLLLKVATDDVQGLKDVLQAANTEAAKTKAH